MSAAVSPPPSGEMNSSHSSEGGSITGYVVVNKCDENLQNSDSSENGKQAEIPAKSESLAQAGSMSQDELVDRVQNLTKENEELKGVLLQNNKLLEEYFQDLANMQKSQKQTNESLRKGYDHAREVVKKLREKNGTLKTDLKNEQNKNVQLEEQLSKLKDANTNESSTHLENKTQDDKGNTSQVQSLEEVVKRLESEKVTLEMNNSKLQEHISCLKAMRDAEPNTETDDCETLVSLEPLSSDIQLESPEALQENYNKLETEKEILKVDLERMKIENEQKQQQCSQLEEDHNQLLKKLQDLEQRQAVEAGERDQLLKKIQDMEQRQAVETGERDQLLKKIQDMKQRQAVEAGDKPAVTDNQAATAAASEQITALCGQLQVQTEVIENLTKELDTLTRESETYKKKAEELEKTKTAENEDIERMRQKLQNYQEKDRENQEAAEKQAALHANLTKEIAELKQQLETESQAVGNLRKDLDNLTQERDACKVKVQELEMHPEGSKVTGEETSGSVEDTRLVEKLKRQIWTYQTREGNILNKENALLEKEEKQKQVVKEKEDLERQLAEALKEKEAIAQERKDRQEETQSLRRQLSSVSDELNETHEREVNQKEELQNTNAAMKTVLDNAEELKVNVTQLMEKNESLEKLVEELKSDCSQKEEEIQSLKEELSSVSIELNETREHEVNQLKEELAKKSEALATAETTMEPLKVQVTQLIQENQSLMAETERLRDECTQQENMYQDHLHKITDDSEKQRIKRDKIIEGLRKQLSAIEAELKNTRTQKETDRGAFQQLREEHERMVTEYDEMLRAYQTTRDKNKKLESEVGKVKADLEQADNHRAKLKEDVKLRDEEIDELKQNVYDLGIEKKNLEDRQEQLALLETQVQLYQSDFQMEREAREKQHEEIMRLTEQVQRLEQENQQYQDEIYQLNNRGIEEMQRRHASVPYRSPGQGYPPQGHQQQQEQPRGWFEGMFTRGPGEPAEALNTQGDMRSPGRGQIGGDQREQRAPAPADENDWQCPTCRRVFPNFDTLQIHAVDCNAYQQPPPQDDLQQNQCPSCMEIFPDMETLEIHVEECLDLQQQQ